MPQSTFSINKQPAFGWAALSQEDVMQAAFKKEYAGYRLRSRRNRFIKRKDYTEIAIVVISMAFSLGILFIY